MVDAREGDAQRAQEGDLGAVVRMLAPGEVGQVAGGEAQPRRGGLAISQPGIGLRKPRANSGLRSRKSQSSMCDGDGEGI